MPWNRSATSDAVARGDSGRSGLSWCPHSANTSVEQVAPAADRPPPAVLELLVGQPRRPQLPQHAHEAGADVHVEEVAGRAPLVGQRPGLGIERALALEQLRVLALQHRDQQALLAAEVVVDERERDAGLLRHRARARAAGAVLDQHLARRVEDLQPGLLPADGASVDSA